MLREHLVCPTKEHRGKLTVLVAVDAAGRFVGISGLDDPLGLLAEEFTRIGTLLDCVAPQRRS